MSITTNTYYYSLVNVLEVNDGVCAYVSKLNPTSDSITVLVLQVSYSDVQGVFGYATNVNINSFTC